MDAKFKMLFEKGKALQNSKLETNSLDAYNLMTLAGSLSQFSLQLNTSRCKQGIGCKV